VGLALAVALTNVTVAWSQAHGRAGSRLGQAGSPPGRSAHRSYTVFQPDFDAPGLAARPRPIGGPSQHFRDLIDVTGI